MTDKEHRIQTSWDLISACALRANMKEEISKDTLIKAAERIKLLEALLAKYEGK